MGSGILVLGVIILVVVLHVEGFGSQSVNSCEFGTGKKRRWVVGGNFSTVTNCDGSSLEADNFAVYSGERWVAESVNGTDGPIRQVVTDKCLNIYVIGDFSSASNVEVSGGVAVLRYEGSSFEGLKGNLKMSSEEGSTRVNSISVDCRNIPTTISSCDCDIYLGGKFEMETYDLQKQDFVTARNLVKFSYEKFMVMTRSNVTQVNIGWEALGGFENNFFSAVEDEVFVVHKKNFGIDLVSNLLFVGGKYTSALYDGDLDFTNHSESVPLETYFKENGTDALGLLMYDLSVRNSIVKSYSSPKEFNLTYLAEYSLQKDSTSDMYDPELNGEGFQDVVVLENSKGKRNIIVNEVYYNPSKLSISAIFVGGDFSFRIRDWEPSRCESLCIYDTDSGGWTPVQPLFNNGTRHVVTKIEINTGMIFVSIEGKGILYKNMKYLNDDKVEWKNAFELTNQEAILTQTENGYYEDQAAFKNSVLFADHWDFFQNKTVVDWYLCSNVDLSCYSNSISFIVQNPENDNPFVDQQGTTGIHFFNTLKQQFFDFGQGTNGEVNAILSYYDYFANE